MLASRTALAVAFVALAPVLCTADPTVLRASFEPEVGPNGYQLRFPPELGGFEATMDISGGGFELETDAAAGTARLLSWRQDVDPLTLFGASTGPIVVTLDPAQPSSGTFNPATGRFNVQSTYLITFDDSGLRDIGFVSPVRLVGTENGTIQALGALGTVAMETIGGGSFAGGYFEYTCRTTAKIDGGIPEGSAQTGDVNRDLVLNIADPLGILQDIFIGLHAACLPAGDVTADGSIGMTDSIFLLRYLYVGGPAPSTAVVACD